MPTPTLAVDTQIIMIAFEMAGDLTPQPCHLSLAAAFETKANLALDKHTRQEYDENMGAGSDGRQWLTRLGVLDRIDFFHSVPTEKKKTRIKLTEIGFSKKDMKFV